MKRSTRILFSIVTMLIALLFLSNMVMKNEYNKVDKSDHFWNFEQVSNLHFKYIKIEGGNITDIAFEPSPNYSVRVLNQWQHNYPELIKTSVINDTLFVKFIYKPSDKVLGVGGVRWLKWTTSVRIFAPELIYVNCIDTNLEMFKLKQKNLTVNMSGKSKFEVESMFNNLDSLNISLKDSSSVVFEMSPEYIPTSEKPIKTPNGAEIKSSEAMAIKSVKANIQGYSVLNLGHAQIDSLDLNIADSSAVILSGGAFRKIK